MRAVGLDLTYRPVQADGGDGLRTALYDSGMTRPAQDQPGA